MIQYIYFSEKVTAVLSFPDTRCSGNVVKKYLFLHDQKGHSLLPRHMNTKFDTVFENQNINFFTIVILRFAQWKCSGFS